jgi:hypothetical protein
MVFVIAKLLSPTNVMNMYEMATGKQTNRTKQISSTSESLLVTIQCIFNVKIFGEIFKPITNHSLHQISNEQG